jgi:hypothetical protein
MNETPGSANPHNPSGSQDHQSALFAHLLMQQTNMAMMLLGKVPHPGTGQTTKDIDSARIFIDMVEMLEAKTRGNLTDDEARLLKQTLMTLRLSFVEAVDSSSAPSAAGTSPAQPTPQPAPAEKPEAAADDEQRKKFTKKY